MKKLIIIIPMLMFVAVCFGSFTNSADSNGTFTNAYEWSGHPFKDKATLWAQEVEAKLEGETASLTLMTVTSYTDSATLTAAQSGSVISMASSGVGVVTLPTAAVGLTYTIIDSGNEAGMDCRITAGSGDTINGGSAAGSYTQTSDTPGNHVKIVAITTTSWITTSISGIWE